MQVRGVQPFGCEVSEINLASGVREAEFASLKALLNEHGFVLFRNQEITASEQAAFARLFGPFSGHNESDRTGILTRDGDGPALRMYYNTEGLGSVNELDLHSDNTHTPYSLRYLTLYGIEFGKDGKPIDGGETLLANAADALDRLPAELRARLEDLQCRNSAQNMGSFVRPCIEHHWETGRPYLVVNSLTSEIIGLDPDEFGRVMTQLREIVYDPQFLYRHRWREGDLLLWDNRLLHHGRGWYDNSQKRTIRRCAIADELEPTAFA